jgi:hypothetical protein
MDGQFRLNLDNFAPCYYSLNNNKALEANNLQTTDPIRAQIATPPNNKAIQTRIIITTSGELKKLFKNGLARLMNMLLMRISPGISIVMVSLLLLNLMKRSCRTFLHITVHLKIYCEKRRQGEKGTGDGEMGGREMGGWGQ